MSTSQVMTHSLTHVPAWQESDQETKQKLWRKHTNRQNASFCNVHKFRTGKQSQQYKGRVVLRGGVVKDYPGFYAVSSEQDSSASHMTVPKVLYVISRLPDCEDEASDTVWTYIRVKMEDSPKLLRLREAECTLIWIRIHRSCGTIGEKLLRTSIGGIIVGTKTRRSFVKIRMWVNTNQDENAYVCIANVALWVYVDDINMARKETIIKPMWKSW